MWVIQGRSTYGHRERAIGLLKKKEDYMLTSVGVMLLSLALAQTKVMVVDTGFVPTEHTKHKVVSFASTDSFKGVGHGTAVTHTLLYGDIINGKPTSKVCDSVEVEICGYTTYYAPDVLISCLDRAVEKKFNYVNMSIGGDPFTTKAERKAFINAANKGIVIVIASGNGKLDLDKSCIYPQCLAKEHKNIIAVGSDTGEYTTGSFVKKEKAWAYAPTSKGEVVLFYGTSFAAPKYINRLLRDKCLNNRGGK